MPVNEFQDTITHELTHIFEFDLLWGNQGGALTAVSSPPGWTFEGLSEYTTAHWSSWSTLILRDTVLNDRIPDFDESGDLLLRYPLPRDPAYDFGHAIYEFIVERFGPNAIRDFWQVLKQSNTLLARRDPLVRAFRRTAREFGQEFKKYLRARFKDYYGRENPEDYSVPLGPEFPINPYYFAFSHALSPSGELVATITYNARDNDMNIVLPLVQGRPDPEDHHQAVFHRLRIHQVRNRPLARPLPGLVPGRRPPRLLRPRRPPPQPLYDLPP